MSKLRFGQVPQNYRDLLLQVEKKHDTCIRIVDELRPGYSGARLFDALESSAPEIPCDEIEEIYPDSVRRLIIKFDQLDDSDQDESSKLRRARNLSSEDFKKHIVSELEEPSRFGKDILYFYSIAGSSTITFKPLSSYSGKEYLSEAFSKIFGSLVEEWNHQKKQTFTSSADMLRGWLGDDPNKTLKSLTETLEEFNISSETSGLILNNTIFPNPVYYLRHQKLPNKGLLAWNGLLHGDLHINNILVEFSRSGEMNDFVLIDFAYFKKKEFLFFDQMYLELSLLLDQLEQGTLTINDWYSLIDLLKRDRVPTPENEERLRSVVSIINAGRTTLESWINANPDRQSQKDDIWLQISLASIAVGLNFFKKKRLARELKWAAMCYAAAHLELLCRQYNIEKPSQFSRFGISTQMVDEEMAREEIWQSLVNYCESFSNEYLYFLVLGPIQDASKLTPIGKVRWSVVLDFNSNLKNTTYKYIAEELIQISSLHLITKESQNELSYVPLKGSYWYAANGISDEDAPNELKEVKDWAKLYIRSIRGFMQKISQVSSHMPIRCIICWDNISYIERVAFMLEEEIPDKFRFAVVSSSDVSKIKNLVAEGEYFRLSTEYFAASIGNLIASQHPTAQILLPTGVERHPSSTNIIEISDANWIDENFSIIHLNIGQKEDPDIPISQFYRGGSIDWFGLSIDKDVRRTMTEDLQKDILDDLESRSTVRYSLYHSPGGGGTTVARRIAWNIHRSYPVLVMKRYNAEAISCIEHIYQKTQRSVLIIVDRTVGLTSEMLEAFYNDLRYRHLPVVLLILARGYSIENSGRRRRHLSETLDSVECQRFFDAYKDQAPQKLDQLMTLSNTDGLGYSKKLATPFYFGLVAFEKEFQQLDSYISEKLENANSLQRETMLYLALAKIYSKQVIPAQYFGKLFGLAGESAVSLQTLLSRGQHKLLIFDPEDNAWEVSHYLIAEEIRNQILDPSANHSSWKNNLVTWLCRFIDYFASISPESGSPNKFVMDLLFQMFVDREYGGIQDVDTGRFQRLVFSPLVMEIRSRISSELAEEGGLVVLKRLTEKFPHPHFQAHFARRLSHTGNHVDAIREALKAVQHEKAKTDYILWHIYGTIIKRYKDELIREYLREYETLGSNPPNSPMLDEIRNLYAQARHAFTRSLEVQKNEYAYISLISLLVKQLDFYYQISGTRQMQDFLKENTKHLEMLEQAENLLDECKYVLRNPETNRYFTDAQNLIKSAYGDFEGIIRSWRDLLSKGVADSAPVRRSLAMALLQRQNRDWDQLEKSDLDEILQLMNQNFLEDPQSSLSNIKLWFEAARRSIWDINSIVERLKVWADIDEDSLEAQYYLYICYVIKSFEEPSQMIRENAERIILQLSQKAARAKIYDPSFSYNLLGMGRGLNRLVFYKRVGSLNEENWYKGKQGQDLLYRVSGTVTSITGPTKGEITIDKTRLRAHFIPGVIRRLSDGSQSEPFLRGRDTNVDVRFFLGFSYNGLRTFEVMRK
jgi:hypothetical protein